MLHYLREGCVGGVEGELLEVWQLRYSRPRVFARSAEKFEDALQFVVGVVAREKRTT